MIFLYFKIPLKTIQIILFLSHHESYVGSTWNGRDANTYTTLICQQRDCNYIYGMVTCMVVINFRIDVYYLNFFVLRPSNIVKWKFEFNIPTYLNYKIVLPRCQLKLRALYYGSDVSGWCRFILRSTFVVCISYNTILWIIYLRRTVFRHKEHHTTNSTN